MSESFSDLGPKFCVYPWIEQVVQSGGKVSYCCVAQNGGMIQRSDGKDFRVSENRLEEAWNSKSMQSLRRAMLEGTAVKDCKLCYFQESIGKRSYREMHNEEWGEKDPQGIRRRVEESRRSGFQVMDRPMYLDLRLGNLCNLKCRSCNPYNSLPIYKESSELLQSDFEFQELWKRSGTGPLFAQEPWYESDGFWDQIISSIPHLRKVYLTGGEPTLIQGNYRFLQACVDSGHAKNIFLMFNVNGTHLPSRLLEFLPHFQFVLMNVSLDGFESDNEYIRFPSRWPIIHRNMETLLEVRGPIQVGVTPVIQIYNILSIVRLLDYVETMAQRFDRLINVDFLYATSPAYLDPQILPASIQREARSRLESYREKSKTYAVEPFLKNSVDSCIRMLSQSEHQMNEKLLKDFMIYTGVLDRKRQQSFSSQFPELHEKLQAEGFKL